MIEVLSRRIGSQIVTEQCAIAGVMGPQGLITQRMLLHMLHRG